MPHPLADHAWRAICAAYARPGAAQELLRRQDEEGLDVLLHLFAQWARDSGHALDDAALREAEAAVQPWRDAAVRPLRALRRGMKAFGPRAEAARQAVKDAELAAERAQLDLLCDWLTARHGGGG